MNPLQHYFPLKQPGVEQIDWLGFKIWLIQHHWGELAIAEQGAQILHFKPSGHHALLWLSSSPKPVGNPIRGGIPICWPWFGDHPNDHNLPAHGTARQANWTIQTLENQAHNAHWRLQPQQRLDPQLDLSLEIKITGSTLSLSLRSDNRGEQSAVISQALHSYFQVSGLNNIAISQLQDCPSYNKLAEQFQSAQPINLSQAVDRIFEHTDGLILTDTGAKTTLAINKQNSRSTVVWNPGSTNLAGDISSAEQPYFICIEAANTAAYDLIELAPGASHCLRLDIKPGPI